MQYLSKPYGTSELEALAVNAELPDDGPEQDYIARMIASVEAIA